jgi:hypothetical protein
MLMSGKPESDEPFLVEEAGGFFEELDSAAVIFDEVVVWGKDTYDSFLFCL